MQLGLMVFNEARLTEEVIAAIMALEDCEVPDTVTAGNQEVLFARITKSLQPRLENLHLDGCERLSKQSVLHLSL